MMIPTTTMATMAQTKLMLVPLEAVSVPAGPIVVLVLLVLVLLVLVGRTLGDDSCRNINKHCYADFLATFL